MVVLGVAVVAGCGTTPPDGAAPAGDGPTTAGSWTRLPDPPLSPRSHSVVVGVGETMLVVGGWHMLCPPNADCETPDERLRDGAVYDLRTDAWTVTPPAPLGLTRRERGTAVVERSAYVLASCSDGADCRAPDRLLEYDVAARAWTDHGPVPGRRTSSLVAAQGLVVAYSSSDEHGESDDVAFDPVTGRWETLPDDPLSRVFDRTMVVAGTHLVVAGSSIEDLDAGRDPAKQAARLDLATRRWTRLPDTGPGYQLLPSDVGPLLNGHFIEAGGWLLDPTTWTWSKLPDLPGGQDDLRGVLDRGGATYEVPNSVGEMSVRFDLRVLDTATRDYVRIPPLEPREHVYDDSSTALGRSLFVYGGQQWVGTRDGKLVGDAWLWTPPEPAGE